MKCWTATYNTWWLHHKRYISFPQISITFCHFQVLFIVIVLVHYTSQLLHLVSIRWSEICIPIKWLVSDTWPPKQGNFTSLYLPYLEWQLFWGNNSESWYAATDNTARVHTPAANHFHLACLRFLPWILLNGNMVQTAGSQIIGTGRPHHMFPFLFLFLRMSSIIIAVL